MTEQEFIAIHLNDDPLSLRLRFAGKDLGFDLEDALIQIEASRKCARKLSRFMSHAGFRFPSVIASEQATDQRVAAFHAQLAAGSMKILDLTAGLGIDPMSIAIANPSASVTAVEIDSVKAICLRENADLLGLGNRIDVVAEDCRNFLNRTDEHYDLLFADPARRAPDGTRCYALKDCEPDLVSLLPLIEEKSDCFMFKVSPMLDVTELTREIEGLTDIYAVSQKGELKELLIKGCKGGILEKLSAVTIYEDGDFDEFILSPEALHLPAPVVEDSSSVRPGMFLYEPDASVMKFGAFGAITSRFPGLVKLNANTHLFVSEWEYNCFPGRVTKIVSVPDKKDLKRLRGCKINVAVRNYPLSAEMLKKKTGISDGGDEFLYGVRIGRDSHPMLILASRN